MSNTIASIVLGDEALEHTTLKTLSLAMLAIALVCGWWPHSQSFLWLWHREVSFTPDFISGTLGLAVIAPLYLRRIIPYRHHSVNGILFLLVNWSLTATFVQIGLKGAGLGTLPALAVIACAIALSWLGMRGAALLAWLVLLIYSVISTLFANMGWGLAGFGFVACGFAGILLQTPLNPGELMGEISSEYSKRKAAPQAVDVHIHVDPMLGRQGRVADFGAVGDESTVRERIPGGE